MAVLARIPAPLPSPVPGTPSAACLTTTCAHWFISRLLRCLGLEIVPDFVRPCSDVIRAPRVVWDGTQEGSLDSGGSAERGWVEDDLFEDADQLIHNSGAVRS